VKTLFSLTATFAVTFMAAQPGLAAGHLSATTTKAWCQVGHGAQAVALDPQTWNDFDLLAAYAQIGITKIPDSYANNPSGFWELNASVMGGAGSEAEDVLLAWLRDIATATKLTHNVDSLRAIAAKLRVAVNKNPGMFYNTAENIARTRKALAQFSRFEKAVDTFAPELAKACKATSGTQSGAQAAKQDQTGSQTGSVMDQINQMFGNVGQAGDGGAQLTDDMVRRFLAVVKELRAQGQSVQPGTAGTAGIAAVAAYDAGMLSTLKAHGFTMQSWTMTQALVTSTMGSMQIKNETSDPQLDAEFASQQKIIAQAKDLSPAAKKQILQQMEEQKKNMVVARQQDDPNATAVRPYLAQLQAVFGK